MKSKTIAAITIGLLIVLTGVVNVRAQGTLVFLNGKEKRVKIAGIWGYHVRYILETSKESRIRVAESYNVFSYQPDEGEELIFYKPDPSDSLAPTIVEVRDYIAGQKFAANRYRKPMNMIGGVASGLAGSVGGFYGIPVPLVYATIVGQFNPKPPKAAPGQVFSESFSHGYQRKARNMKIKNSLIGGGIGFSVGIAALMIFYAND